MCRRRLLNLAVERGDPSRRVTINITRILTMPTGRITESLPEPRRVEL
jgi:hypothetical protein